MKLRAERVARRALPSVLRAEDLVRLSERARIHVKRFRSKFSQDDLQAELQFDWPPSRVDEDVHHL